MYDKLSVTMEKNTRKKLKSLAQSHMRSESSFLSYIIEKYYDMEIKLGVKK
jgi:predicted DNA-binding protein